MADTDTIETAHTVDAPLSKDAYLKATTGPQPGFTSTIDGTDTNIGANVQTDARKDYEGGATALVINDLPGQVFAPHQLPNPAAAIEAGLPPVVIPEGLIFEDASTHPSGPDPMDVATLELRKSLGNPRLNTSGLIETSDGEVVTGPGIAGAPEDSAPVVPPKTNKQHNPSAPVVV